MSGVGWTLGAVGALAAAAALSRSGSRAFGRDGHWGRAGAGVLLTTGKKVLVLLRSQEVTEPGTWNLAGGAVDPGEDALTAGLRELEEETGLGVVLTGDPDDGAMLGSYVWQSPTSSFRYTTSVVRVPASWTTHRIELNWENDEARWVDAAWLEAHRAELHPGLRAALPALLPLAFGNTGSRAVIRLTGRSSTSTDLARLRERFFAAFNSDAGEGQTFYMGPFVVVGDRKGGVLGKLEIYVRSMPTSGEPGVSLSYIGVNREGRQQGRGTRLLQIVLEAADDVGLPVYLTVSPEKEHGDTKPPMTKKQLRAFYAKFGFHTVPGMEADYMERDAR
jgi:8-oxo-dGTP pyrophosphatase MutT (NUDIX family)